MATATSQEDVTLRIEGLRMTYHPGLFERSKEALKSLDLSVPRGCIYGFLGQNGAGKTTTIKILVGLLHATGGRAWIFGRGIEDRMARLDLGFMPENPYFYEYLTAQETLEFFGKLSGMSRDERRRRSAELLERFSLTHATNVRMREFSKGMRQRLGLAQAMLHRPKLVILDEPMSGLDPLGRRDIRNEILALRDEGATVFFSSHILGDVQDVSDYVCILHKGEKISDGPLSSLLSRRVKEVELGLTGVPDEARDVAALSARRAWFDGSMQRFMYPDEDSARAAKEQLEKAGARLRMMIPHQESLEEYFVQITKDDRDAAVAESPPSPLAASAGEVAR